MTESRQRSRIGGMIYNDNLRKIYRRKQTKYLETKDKARINVKRKEIDFLSNTIAVYAYIKANPESFGLYFVISVCFGLVRTFCLLVIWISSKPYAITAPSTPEKKQLKDSEEEEEDEESDDNEEVEDAGGLESSLQHSTTEIPMSNHLITPDGTLSRDVFTSAEEL